MKKIIPFAFVLLLAFSVHAEAVYPIIPGTTISVSVSNSASSATSLGLSFGSQAGTAQVMVTNTGSNICFVAFGGSGVTATTSSTPVPAGSIEVFTVNQDMTYVSAITSSSTTTCYFTIGAGD